MKYMIRDEAVFRVSASLFISFKVRNYVRISCNNTNRDTLKSMNKNECVS